MDYKNTAIFLDFENLAISAEQSYPSKEKPLKIEPIIDFCSAKGNIAIKKAYADWSKEGFSQYQNMLMEQGFELIYLPETSAQGKNGSDVKLAVDVMETLELHKTIGTIIIGSGDTDFIPLIQQIRSRGMEVIVMGFEYSVGTLVKRNTTEFKSLEELLGQAEDEAVDEQDESDEIYGRDILIRYMKNANQDEPILLSQLKPELLKIEPSFSEKKANATNFKKYIVKFKGDLIERISATGPKNADIVYFKPLESVISIEIDSEIEVKTFLKKKVKYISDNNLRTRIFSFLIDEFKNQRILTMEKLIDLLSKFKKSITEAQAKKVLNVLYAGRVFIQDDMRQKGPLLNRSFKLKVTVVDDWSAAYTAEVKHRLQDRFPDIDNTHLTRFLAE